MIHTAIAESGPAMFDIYLGQVQPGINECLEDLLNEVTEGENKARNYIS